jgi:hypothetical protein
MEQDSRKTVKESQIGGFMVEASAINFPAFKLLILLIRELAGSLFLAGWPGRADFNLK